MTVPFIITVTNGAAWSTEFQTNGGYFDTRKKSSETRSEVDVTLEEIVSLQSLYSVKTRIYEP